MGKIRIIKWLFGILVAIIIVPTIEEIRHYYFSVESSLQNPRDAAMSYWQLYLSWSSHWLHPWVAGIVIGIIISALVEWIFSFQNKRDIQNGLKFRELYPEISAITDDLFHGISNDIASPHYGREVKMTALYHSLSDLGISRPAFPKEVQHFYKVAHYSFLTDLAAFSKLGQLKAAKTWAKSNEKVLLDAIKDSDAELEDSATVDFRRVPVGTLISASSSKLS